MLEVSLRHRLWVVAVALLLPVPALAGTISLAWNRVAGAAGYRVYYGTSSGTSTGEYPVWMDAGNACQADDSCEATVAGLADCTAWYLAVKAYDSTGRLSAAFSNEVSGWPAPRVDSLSVVSTKQGTQVTLEIRGANFPSGSSVEFVPPSGAGIACGGQGSVPAQTVPNPALDTVQATSVSLVGGDCGRLQALVSVAGSIAGEHAAEVGSWDVEVLGPADSLGKHVFGESQDAFAVQINPIRYDVNTSDEGTAGVKKLTTADTQWLFSSYASLLVNPNTCGRDPRYLEDLDLDANGMIDGDDIAYIYSSGVTDLLETCWTGTTWSAGACPSR
jgi:hypothetical protein